MSIRHYSLVVAVATILSIASVTHAQVQEGVGVNSEDGAIIAKNALFLELGGNAVVWSINYDRLLTDHVSARIGYGSLGLSTTAPVSSNGVDTSATGTGSIQMIPLTVSYLVGSGNSKFEIGAGLVYGKIEGTLFSTTYSASGIGETVILGYRYEPTDGGLFFRAAATPVFAYSYTIPMFGVGFGYSF